MFFMRRQGSCPWLLMREAPGVEVAEPFCKPSEFLHRTGTVAFILEGLCGVPEADLAIGYELTSFAMFGLRTRVGTKKFPFAKIVERIKAYPGATLQAKLEAYAKGTLGLTDEEIAEIRRNLRK